MSRYLDLAPEVILSDLIHRPDHIVKTYIIMGRTGPTGKTWLCDQLK